MAKRQVAPKTHVIQGGCDPMQYENKVETIKRIHLLNLLSKNNPKGEQKPSQKNFLLINVACVGMPS